MIIDTVLEQARTQVHMIEPEELAAVLDQYLVVDVREPQEVLQGFLPSAINIARGLLEFKAVEDPLFKEHNRPIVLYSGGGARSVLAALSLQQLGFTRVVSLAGGIERWSMEGYPVA